MKAYNEQGIYNRAVLVQAEPWHRQQLLTDDQMAVVRKTYPVEFRRTNGFIEIGLFLFTTVAILGTYLLLTTIVSSGLDDRHTYGLFNLIFGLALVVGNHLIINRGSLYRNGVDNAFVVTLTGFLAMGFNQFLPATLPLWANCLFTLPLLLLILWYYGDTLIAFLTLATFYTFIFDSLLDVTWGKDVLPFVMMGVSGILYAITRQSVNRFVVSPYYADPVNLIQWIALIVLAAGGNYYVVREMNGVLLGSGLPDAPEINLPWLFWLLTFLIPTIYLWQGFTKKNRMLIILGSIGIMAAVATVHEYVGWLSLNVFLAVSGLALIGIAVAGIRFFSQPRSGFTDAPDDDSPDSFFVNAETIGAIQATAGAQQTPKDNLRFGGGNFGGGGSEGQY
ncbi:hypothetical protein GCM10027341_55600 [Spirosoma knui]